MLITAQQVAVLSDMYINSQKSIKVQGALHVERYMCKSRCTIDKYFFLANIAIVYHFTFSESIARNARAHCA